MCGWRGGPWGDIDPSTIERGGLGQCRGKGRAGPQVQIQSQGRPRGGTVAPRKAHRSEHAVFLRCSCVMESTNCTNAHKLRC